MKFSFNGTLNVQWYSKNNRKLKATSRDVKHTWFDAEDLMSAQAIVLMEFESRVTDTQKREITLRGSFRRMSDDGRILETWSNVAF